MIRALALSLLLALTGCMRAADQPDDKAVRGAETVPPYGYLEFCVRHPSHFFCEAGSKERKQ